MPAVAAVSASSTRNGSTTAPAATTRATRSPLATLLFNETPSLTPTRIGQSAAGVVTGQLNATDTDSATLAYTVVSAPASGTVSVDSTGLYTYTPDPVKASAGYTDSFAVSVSDAGSGFHIHGLMGLLNLLSFGLIGDSGHSATTTVNVVVNAVGPASPPPLTQRLVYATATDSRITAAPDSGEAPHVVINPSPAAPQRGELVVFLPGTQGRPSQYTDFLRTAANLGFYAIGLNYPNQTTMASLCRTSSSPSCYWDARNEVLVGNLTPVGGQSPVTEADSIINRLDKLVVWMNQNYPTEGWGQFLLGDGTVDWSKVVLAGHSQGGGYVGVMAKTVLLDRAIYFSSPDDWNALADQPAEWTLRPNVTPADRQFGFGSDADTLVPNDHAFAIWDNLGLPRPASGPVLIDNARAPYSSSHQLHTALPYNPASTAFTTGLKNHGITVVDASTPVDGSGQPLFATNGLWAYLLG